MQATDQSMAVHHSHVSRWGESFGNADLGTEIMANPRLRDRAVQRISDYYGMPHTISQTDQSAEAKMVDLIIADEQRVRRIAGLLELRGVLREVVTPEGYRLLAGIIPHSDIEIACALSSKLPPKSSIGIDNGRFGERVDAAGHAVLSLWAIRLPEFLIQRIAFALGNDTEILKPDEEGRVDAGQACRIMETLSTAEIWT